MEGIELAGLDHGVASLEREPYDRLSFPAGGSKRAGEGEGEGCRKERGGEEDFSFHAHGLSSRWGFYLNFPRAFFPFERKARGLPYKGREKTFAPQAQNPTRIFPLPRLP